MIKRRRLSVLSATQFSPFTSAMLSTASDGGTVRIWDVHSKKCTSTFDSHKAPASSLCYSPINSSLLVSGGLDKQILFYDVRKKRYARMT